MIRLIIGTILLRSLATIFAKMAALISVGRGLEGIIINIWSGAELIALVLQAILWSHVLNKYSLNKAYPYMSLVFGVNLAAAWLIFHERVSLNHLLGILIIIVGIIITHRDNKTSIIPE